MGTWHLSLRSERPVEGCEVGALAYLYQKSVKKNKSGIPVEAAQPPPPSVGNYELRFRWLRGPESPVCMHAGCSLANNFSPLVWSSHARGDARSLACIDESMVRRMGLPVGPPCVFCSTSCFRNAWATADEASVGDGSSNGGSLLQRSSSSGVSRERSNSTSGPPSMQRSHSLSSAADLAARKADSFADAGDNGNGGGAESWVEVCSDRVFTPSAADVGRRFRLECTCYNPDGSLLFGPKSIRLEPTLASPPAPPKRPVVTVKGASNGGGYRFRVLSYNLLAEIYATQQMYPHCDFWALGWGYRLPNLLRELRDAVADVLCLQEVQADHFEKNLKPWLYESGFDGLYKQKTRDAMGPAGKVDGCAIFWRRSKFRLAEHYGVEFNDCARSLAQQIATSDEHERDILGRLMKDNVGMVAVLEVLLPGNPQRTGRLNRMGPLQVAVANTHLYSNKDYPDVKLWQCLSLVRELEQLVLSRDLPLVVCGDFNSVPSSAVYDLLAHHAVPEGHPDLQEDALRVLPPAPELSHGLDLLSAYRTVLGEEPPYTNFTTGFTGVLDYIWCSGAHIRPLAVASMPKEDVLKRAGVSLPNPQQSSDHLMLCADLQLGGTLHPHPSPSMSTSSSSGPLGPGGIHSNSNSSHHSQQSQSSSSHLGHLGQMGGQMAMGQQPGLVMPQQQLPPPPPPPPPPAMGVSDFPSLAPPPNSAKKRDQRR